MQSLPDARLAHQGHARFLPRHVAQKLVYRFAGILRPLGELCFLFIFRKQYDSALKEFDS